MRRHDLRRRRLVLGAATVAVGLLSMQALSGAEHLILAGDPAIFRQRMGDIFGAGAVPYVDAPFEHLPAMLIPMGLAWYAGGAASANAFVFTFVPLMILCLVVAGVAVDSLGERLSVPSASVSWLVVVAPLIPLVIFRNDPFVVMVFVVASVKLVQGSGSAATWGAVASLAKIWPAALAVWALKSRQKTTAAIVAVSGVAGFAITLAPGFTQARAAAGIHAETVVGGLIGAVRTLAGAPSGVELTTAAYLPVGWWPIILNAVLGGVIALAGCLGVWWSRDHHGAFVSLGMIVVGVILASPLFSLQYVLWLSPFIALARSRVTQLVGFLLGVLTLCLALVWTPEVFESPIFFGLITLRNGLVLGAAALFLAEARGKLARQSEAKKVDR